MKRTIFIPILIIVIIIIILLFATFSSSDDNYIGLFEHENYKNLKVQDIGYIEELTYTVSGIDTIKYDDSTKIQNTFDELQRIKIGKISKQSCDDNTIIYNLHLKDDTTVSIEMECNFIIIDGISYEIRKK